MGRTVRSVPGTRFARAIAGSLSSAASAYMCSHMTSYVLILFQTAAGVHLVLKLPPERMQSTCSVA